MHWQIQVCITKLSILEHELTRDLSQVCNRHMSKPGQEGIKLKTTKDWHWFFRSSRHTSRGYSQIAGYRRY